MAITPLTGKPVKNPKKSSIFDHMLFEGYRSNFDNFSILLKENNDFKIQLKDASSRSESSFLNNNGFVVEILFFAIISKTL